MIERLKAGLVIAAAAAFLIPFIPQGADAQEPGGRFRVIIPDVVPTDGSDPHFGDRVSGYLRDMIDLPTHVAMPKSEIDERAKEFDVSYDDLDCNLAIQFANQAQGRLVMCGEYEAQNGEYLVSATFVTVPDGDELVVEPFTVGQEEWVAAAEHLSESFDTLVDELRTLARCNDALRSSNWNEAVDQCNRALEIAPESYQVRRALANAYLETEQWEQALEHYEVLLEERPRDDAVLQSAGWVAGQAEETERARDYYTRYLELNPEDVGVRIQVAYDLAETGDPYGAMTLLEEGLEQEPDNADLHDRFGTYSFRAALQLQEENGEAAADDPDTDEPELVPDAEEVEGPDLSSEVEELFRQAIRSYEFVLEDLGPEARVSHATNAMRAYRQLGEYDEAIRIGRMATDLFPESADVHSQLASAYNDAGDVDNAIAALDEAMAINPELSQGHIRKGVYLLQAGRVDEGIQALRAAADAGEESPDQLALMVFSHGYSNYVQEGQHEEGIRLIEAAKEFDVSSETREQLDFFHGFSLYEFGIAVQEPSTLNSAQSALPIFQRAREQVQEGAPYARRSGNDPDELLQAIDQYIEIQEAVIAREGRR